MALLEAAADGRTGVGAGFFVGGLDGPGIGGRASMSMGSSFVMPCVDPRSTVSLISPLIRVTCLTLPELFELAPPPELAGLLSQLFRPDGPAFG